MPVKTAIEETRELIDRWDREHRSINRELARMKAEMLFDTFQAYKNAGFSHEDAVRLMLQDAVISQAGNRAIVQGLSFSDLLEHNHRPEVLD